MRRLQLTPRRALLATAAGSAAAIYGAFLLYETPGLGIGHFYYLSILLAALATGPWFGAISGAAATGLYATGVVLNPSIQSSEVLSASTAIRLVTFRAGGGGGGPASAPGRPAPPARSGGCSGRAMPFPAARTRARSSAPSASACQRSSR